MAEAREERDMLGSANIPAAALWGIHAFRADENFPLAMRPIHREMVHAYGAVKLAACRVNQRLGYLTDKVSGNLSQACEEMMRGELDAEIRADALQGGAGTSTNMNVNEVLANRALILMGHEPGDYATIDPYGHVNLHQSTNDTFPTALRVAAIFLLRALEAELVALQEEFQQREKDFAHVVKMGRTEMQDAVLITLGREMGAYAEAFNRDRWRVFKCEERLRVVNLGGTAIGTGLSAPRQYIFQVVDELKAITGIGFSRAENLVEATQNTDVFVEVSGILKAVASNLFKVSNDLRLLSSGPHAGLGEINLPPRQAGSSIMPGKVNPVIPEAVMQAAMRVMAGDQEITQACSLGTLELNPFLPLIADSLLGSLDLLKRSANILRRHCVEGITANEDKCRSHALDSTATVTALLEKIGYKAGQELVREAEEKGLPLRALILEKKLMSAEEFAQLTAPEAVNRLGSPGAAPESK